MWLYLDYQLLLGEGCFFGLVPTGDGHVYGFGGINEPRFPEPLEGRLERFRQRYADFGGAVPEYLASLSCDEQIYCGAVEWAALEQWHSGRVVLIGDAAHAGPPTMAEGGCMAMEDTYVLAEVLRDADTVEEALSSYVSRRRSRADWVQQQSRAVVESLFLPPVIRNSAFRERGDQEMHDRYCPLILAP